MNIRPTRHVRHRAVRTAALTTALASIVFGLAAGGTARASAGSPSPASSPAGSAPAGSPSSAARSAPPAFLAPEDMPPHTDSPWYAGEPTGGLPENPVFCLDPVLPAEGASHRQFRTEYDTSAVQVSVRTATVREARTLAAEARESVQDCAAALEEEDLGTDAAFRDHGRVDVQEGAHVYSVDTAHELGASDVHLFGVGRDGRTVTVVVWGRMGDFPLAPVDAFRTTTRTAVEKLHG